MKRFNYSTIASLFFTFIFTLMIISCDDNGVDSQDNKDLPNDPNAEIADLNGLPFAEGMTRATGDGIDLPNLDPIENEENGSAVIEAIYNDIKGIIINRTKVYNTGFVHDEQSIFNPAGNQIFPANVFLGSSIPNGKFLNLPNHTVGSITWSANGLIPENNMNVFSYQTTNPKSSSYNSIIQSWLSTPIKPLGSTTTYELNEISTSKEIGVKLGVGFDTDDISARLNISGKHESARTHVLVKAVQKSFSIAMDLPDGGILKTANIDDMGGVMPVYVSEVFYGRMGFAIISSNHEYHEVVAALNLNIPTDNIDINIETSYKEILDAAASSQYIIGGGSGEHGEAVSNGWEGFKSALAAPVQPSTAKPVAYVLRYVHDNSVARVVLSGNFTLNESYFIPDVDELEIEFTPTTARAKAGNRKPIYLYGSASVKLHDKSNWQTIFDRPSSNYIKLDDGDSEVQLEGFMTESISLKRPSGMSMKEFLNLQVDIRGNFYNSDVNGTRPLDDLGNTNYTVTVRDLIFSALNGKSHIYTSAKNRREYEANIGFNVNIINRGVKKLNNRYGE